MYSVGAKKNNLNCQLLHYYNMYCNIFVVCDFKIGEILIKIGESGDILLIQNL